MKIDLKSGIPIYMQIVEQVKLSALFGRYRNGDRLPPVRELALELRINPNTVAKAYQILKDENIIDSRPGGGNFISIEEKSSDAMRETMLSAELKTLIDKADTLGMDRVRLSEIFHQLLNRKDKK
ncbi:MAG: GntR family transcriptional regulator [Victivallaceae bacterium]